MWFFCFEPYEYDLLLDDITLALGSTWPPKECKHHWVFTWLQTRIGEGPCQLGRCSLLFIAAQRYVVLTDDNVSIIYWAKCPWISGDIKHAGTYQWSICQLPWSWRVQIQHILHCIKDRSGWTGDLRRGGTKHSQWLLFSFSCSALIDYFVA